MHLHFTLSFADKQWICSSDIIRFSASSLQELDTDLEEKIKDIHGAGNYIVKMFFDFDSFPQWHRQYMPHYFNREIHISITN